MKTPLLTGPFRPFFLLAGMLALVLVPLWLHVYGGIVVAPSHLGPIGWHAHEMLFGYTSAVIAGFLLTAAANWTGRPTVRPWSLLGLVLVWIAGRIMMWFSARLPFGVVMCTELAFFVGVAVSCAVPIIKTRNFRNLGLVVLVLGLGLCDAAVLMHAYGRMLWLRNPLIVALDTVLIIIAIVGGRIIPNFTRNALGHLTMRARGPIDALALVGVVSVAVIDATPLSSSWMLAAFGTAAGVANLSRMRGWHSLQTIKHPIVFVLHLGYAWLGVGLLLRGLSAWVPDRIPTAAAIHTLSIGAIGTLTLGMMARVALGHTGRKLVFHPTARAAMILMTGTVLVRVFGTLAPRTWYLPSLIVAGTLWTLAFGLFLYHYVPILLAPRPDGRPG
ncbi:MAG: NnrS family protein [Myxococcales bacterium]|nr:NnrS family protein [Myxococcales bacterium]